MVLPPPGHVAPPPELVGSKVQDHGGPVVRVGAPGWTMQGTGLG